MDGFVLEIGAYWSSGMAGNMVLGLWFVHEKSREVTEFL